MAGQHDLMQTCLEQHKQQNPEHVTTHVEHNVNNIIYYTKLKSATYYTKLNIITLYTKRKP